MERIQTAIQRAKEQRDATDAPPERQAAVPRIAVMNAHRETGAPEAAGAAPAAAAPVDPDAIWGRIESVSLDPRHLARRRVIGGDRHDPAHVAFDVLRTRLLQALKARGWSRVAVTSPSQGCGKTFVAANLALSLSRQASCRTVLMDMDLRLPRLAAVLGIEDPGSMHGFLTGAAPAERYLRRIRPNLAAGLNAHPVSDAAEVMQEPRTAAVLEAMQIALRPDVVLYDLPPALAYDDVIAFMPQVDGVLLVAGGGITQAADIRKCERLFADQVPLLGVILNRAEDARTRPYGA